MPTAPACTGNTACTGASCLSTLENGRLVWSPARPRYTLDELLAGMKAGDMPTAPGWADAPAVGREAW